MSFPLALTPPIIGAFAFRSYAGFGILGADIPTDGDTGGSPVLNDGILPTAEYYWRIETLPDSGILRIYPNLTFEHEGATGGLHPWAYRLYENRVDQGVGTVYDQFGPYFVTAQNSQQANQCATGSVRQTHLAIGANSNQGNTCTPGSVSQTTTTFIVGSHSTQVNSALAGSINQRHLISAANSQQHSQASNGSVSQSSSTFIVGSNSAQVNNASTATIRQTHLINVANCNQRNLCSTGRINNGQTTGMRVKFNGVIVDVTSAYSKQGGVYVPVIGHAKHGGSYRQFS